jgi:1-acyl-sn-glycerol-3-phosphate acyltransferase
VVPVPTLGPSIPRRRNRFTQAIGRFVLWLMGWRLEGGVPDRPQAVTVVAPHTSNWDFVVGLAAEFAIDLQVRFLAKDSLFKPPLGRFMRAVGGIPVDRKSPEGVVEAATHSFRNEPRLFLVIAPEGTRARVERWKTGFWRIARAAGVPVWTVALDYERRVVRLDPAFETTSDLEADLVALQARFSAEMARHPGNYGLRANVPSTTPTM